MSGSIIEPPQGNLRLQSREELRLHEANHVWYIAVADAVKVLKGVTAKLLFQSFPELKQRLWGGHLWSPSYYVGTAGNVSAETIRRYIERSEHVTKRR